MRQRLIVVLAFALTAALAFSGAASAKSFYVNNAAELQAALDEADSNGQADTITLAAGTYNTDDNGGGNTFIYTAAKSETYALTIRGAGAGGTIIHGNDNREGMYIDLKVFRG
ncbi:MAG: hypothetical protein JRF65_08545, partial [Deltaproteobacteria bacterium]|nr:hypothetical protein [Deltaproteobacteria bacterium]